MTKRKTNSTDADRSSKHRIERASKDTIQSSWKKPRKIFRDRAAEGASIFCGWGQVLFGHTYENLEDLKEAVCQETDGTRNIALYLRDPHVLISMAPQEIFLDPSHTYRIWFERYYPSKSPSRQFRIRRAENSRDLKNINKVLKKRGMVPLAKSFATKDLKTSKLIYFIAEDLKSNEPLGAVMGLDHAEIFDDPEKGVSLWSLCVDPHAKHAGLGEGLTRHLIEFYKAKGRSYLDLSVLHNNELAIKLYEKLGFERVPIFCVKNKNAINEPLFIAPEVNQTLNPYADIIIREARRRGISFQILDEDNAIFDLSFGGRTITCQESLTELTSSIAFIRCSHKPTTIKLFKQAGLKTPQQAIVKSKSEANEFLKKHNRVVVKPLVGEQGTGVAVDIQKQSELHQAMQVARTDEEGVILESFQPGIDLRIVVIDYEVVAASTRKPPSVIGDGRSTIKSLISKQNRRLAAATGGESKIPTDAETLRCLKNSGFKMDDILSAGQELVVRKTANLHTGGLMEDVTDVLNPHLGAAAVGAAQALKIPVVGLDMIVKSVEGKNYVFIEANERPGLANHEPQPTAEKFIDLLFPQTKTEKIGR